MLENGRFTKLARLWQKTLLASVMSMALLPLSSEARVVPNIFTSTGASVGSDTVTLSQFEKVMVDFNLDVALQYDNVLEQPGNSCNEFWDNGVERVKVVGDITNATNCPHLLGCRLVLKTDGVLIGARGKIPNGNGGYTRRIPSGYTGEVIFDVKRMLKNTGPNSVERTFDIQLRGKHNSQLTMKLKEGSDNVTQIVVENEPLADTEEELGLDQKKVDVMIDADGLGNGLQSHPGRKIKISTIQVKHKHSQHKPNFLLISGVPGSKYMYRNMIPELAKIGNVYAYDRPGLGGSEKVTDLSVYGYSIINERDLIDKLVNKLNIDRDLIIIANENGTLGAEAYVRDKYQKNDPSNFVKGLVMTEPFIDACKAENTVTWDSDFSDKSTHPPFYFETVTTPNGEVPTTGIPIPNDFTEAKGLCTRGFTTAFWGDQFGGVFSYDKFRREVAAQGLDFDDPADKPAINTIAKNVSILNTWTGAFHNSPYNDFDQNGGSLGACIVFTGAFGVYFGDGNGNNFGGITLLTQNNVSNDAVLRETLRPTILRPEDYTTGLSQLPADITDPTQPFGNAFVNAACFDTTTGAPTVNPLTRYPRTIPFPAKPDNNCENNQDGGYTCPNPESNQVLADNNAASMAANQPSGVLFGLPRLILLGDTPEAGGTFIWHPTQVEYLRDTLNWDVRCVGQGGHILPDDSPINMIKRIKQWGHENNLF